MRGGTFVSFRTLNDRSVARRHRPLLAAAPGASDLKMRPERFQVWGAPGSLFSRARRASRSGERSHGACLAINGGGRQVNTPSPRSLFPVVLVALFQGEIEA